MSTFPSSSQPGAYEPRRGVTSNPFMTEGQSQQPSAASAASLHPSQVLYAQNSLAEAALYETLTPLPSPPLSMLGQPQDDIAAAGQAELTRYRPNDGFTPGNRGGSRHRLPAGTWATDMTGDVFADDAVRLTPSHNSPQVFRTAPGTPDVAQAYRGSFLDHRQLPSALQQGANSCFYGWPTPPVENSHLMSWCVDQNSGQAENYPLSVHIAAQLDGASSRTSFGRGPGARQQGGSYLGLYASSSVPPAQMGIHGVSEQGHYYQHDLQMDGGIAAETIASIAQEQMAHDRYQQQERTKLHLAASRQQIPQPSDARQSQQAGCYQPPSGLERRSTPPRPKLTTTFWEEERTTCYQVDAHGVCVARRKDNNMVNGTKLLNVAGLSRGKRDALLKGEKERHVVRSGPMPLKGVWIPFERAMALSAQFGIDSNMHPLFEGELDRYLLFAEPREQAGDGPLPLSVLSRPSLSAVTSESVTAAGGADPPASASAGVVPSSYSVPEEYRDFIIPS